MLRAKHVQNTTFIVLGLLCCVVWVVVREYGFGNKVHSPAIVVKVSDGFVY